MEDSKAQTDVTTKQQPDEPYQSILEAAYKQIHEIGSNDEGWTNVKTDLGVKISKKTVQDKEYMRGETELPCSADEYRAFLKEFDRRKEWDPLLVSQKKVKQLSKHAFVVYLIFQGQWPVAQRDMSVVASATDLKDEANTSVVAAVSVIDPDVPEVSGNVRADTLAGYILVPKTGKANEPGVKVTAIICVDLKGWVPGWIGSMVGVEAPLVIGRISTIIESDRQKKAGWFANVATLHD